MWPKHHICGVFWILITIPFLLFYTYIIRWSAGYVALSSCPYAWYYELFYWERPYKYIILPPADPNCIRSASFFLCAEKERPRGLSISFCTLTRFGARQPVFVRWPLSVPGSCKSYCFRHNNGNPGRDNGIHEHCAVLFCVVWL